MILHQDQEGATPTWATIHMFFLMEDNKGHDKCVTKNQAQDKGRGANGLPQAAVQVTKLAKRHT